MNKNSLTHTTIGITNNSPSIDTSRSTALVVPGQLTETSLILPNDLPFDEWERVGQMLQHVEKSVRWWIGDWLAYGERTYGEMYTQAIEATGRTYGDLRSMESVAARVPVVKRLTTLSWSHHAEVAAIEPAEQSRWLTKADTEDWSTRDLRDQLRLTRTKLTPDRAPKCSRCGHVCRVCEIEILSQQKKRKGAA